MADENLDVLLKTVKTADNSKISLEQSKKFHNSKRKINGICKALTLETQKYKPQKTVETIETYILSTDKLDRILYSEISNYIFSLDMAQRGIFATNVEKLLLFALDDSSHVNADCWKMIVKIYDHCQLALHQIENAQNIFANSIDEAKTNLQNEIKKVEKEYISILGIFAAIVLAFVGGITFSTSVLQSIAGVSIFRLLLIVVLLAFILINVIYLLTKFVAFINEKDTDYFGIKKLNITCAVIAALIIIGWILNVNSLSEFMADFLPWCK